MSTSVTWTGVSGTPYTFEVFPVGTEFNPVAAVYILSRTVPHGIGFAYEALYVGETNSLVQRLNTGRVNHDGYKRASAIGFGFIGALRCDNEAERLRIETDLRHGLNPVCNAEPVNALVSALLRR